MMDLVKKGLKLINKSGTFTYGYPGFQDSILSITRYQHSFAQKKVFF